MDETYLALLKQKAELETSLKDVNTQIKTYENKNFKKSYLFHFKFGMKLLTLMGDAVVIAFLLYLFHTFIFKF